MASFVPLEVGPLTVTVGDVVYSFAYHLICGQVVNQVGIANLKDAKELLIESSLFTEAGLCIVYNCKVEHNAGIPIKQINLAAAPNLTVICVSHGLDVRRIAIVAVLYDLDDTSHGK